MYRNFLVGREEVLEPVRTLLVKSEVNYMQTNSIIDRRKRGDIYWGVVVGFLFWRLVMGPVLGVDHEARPRCPNPSVLQCRRYDEPRCRLRPEGASLDGKSISPSPSLPATITVGETPVSAPLPGL